ncbi:MULTISPECIES: hypothetical protein [Burkholderia]|nr:MULTISPECIES: hypothetical protein [Burkholderia]
MLARMEMPAAKTPSISGIAAILIRIKRWSGKRIMAHVRHSAA